MHTDLINTKELTFKLPQLNVERIQNLVTLGMEHQLNMEIAQHRTEVANKLYPKLSTYEVYLYKFAFPNTLTQIHEYANERIPDFVIDNVATSNKLNLFETVQIWRPEDKTKTDPIMVGIIGGDVFNLGIWGDPLINLEAVEKQMLGNFYNLRHRVKNVIDKMLITSALNKFTVTVVSNSRFDVHCKSGSDNLREFLCFTERDENRVYYNHRRLALCPQCQKIVDCSPTVME